jgi:hypothetical protein
MGEVYRIGTIRHQHLAVLMEAPSSPEETQAPESP